MTTTPDLLAAINNGDHHALTALLAQDPAAANTSTGTGTTALMLAIYTRQPEIVRLLIEHGAVINLHAAAALGDTPHIHTLLAAQAQPIDEPSPDGWTALALAAHYDQLDAARLLLDHGADITTRSKNDNGNTPLHAALAGQSPHTTALLLERGADVNAADANGWTPLHLAAASGQSDLVRLVLGYHPFIDPENRNGITPLGLAHSGGHTAIVDLLQPHSATTLP